jgi:putative tricarboxylic transport membrane protein
VLRGLFASKDFLAGNLYIVFGLLGLWLGRDLDSGTPGAMGAGYFPRLVCALLIAIGAALAALSFMRAGEGLERGKWRPFVFVTLSCLAFALLLYPLGLVLTLALTTVLARLADANIRIIPLLLLCAVLIVINVGIFVVGLRVAIPLWPAAL